MEPDESSAIRLGLHQGDGALEVRNCFADLGE